MSWRYFLYYFVKEKFSYWKYSPFSRFLHSSGCILYTNDALLFRCYPHARTKYWTSPQKTLGLLVYKTWRILYKPVEFFISYLRMYITFFCVFVCMYSRQQLSKGPCKYCFSVLSCSETKLVLGKALFCFFPLPTIHRQHSINKYSKPLI